MGGVVLPLQREGFGQLTTRINIAIQHIYDGTAGGLATQIGFNDGRDARLPRHLDGSAIAQHDHYISIDGRHCFNQRVM